MPETPDLYKPPSVAWYYHWGVFLCLHMALAAALSAPFELRSLIPISAVLIAKVRC